MKYLAALIVAAAAIGCSSTTTTTAKDGSVTVVTKQADGKAIAEVNTLTGLALQVWLASHPVVTQGPIAPLPVAK